MAITLPSVAGQKDKREPELNVANKYNVLQEKENKRRRVSIGRFGEAFDEQIGRILFEEWYAQMRRVDALRGERRGYDDRSGDAQGKPARDATSPAASCSVRSGVVPRAKRLLTSSRA